MVLPAQIKTYNALTLVAFPACIHIQANFSLLTLMFESYTANEDVLYNNPWTLGKWYCAIPPRVHWIQITPFKLTFRPELPIVASIKLRNSN